MTPKQRADKSQVLFPAGLPVSKPVHYDAGETIFSQGDECTDVRYIEEGVVKLTLVSNRGRGGILGFLGRGDFFGTRRQARLVQVRCQAQFVQQFQFKGKNSLRPRFLFTERF